MREIKFRAIREKEDYLESDEWVYGGIGTCASGEFIIIQDGEPIIVYKETIGEYTGINDINGKEIYEGDIVEKEIMEPFEESKFIGVVQMIEGCWCVVNDKKLLAKNLWDETDINSVIGNIYNNPKLLEE